MEPTWLICFSLIQSATAGIIETCSCSVSSKREQVSSTVLPFVFCNCFHGPGRQAHVFWFVIFRQVIWSGIDAQLCLLVVLTLAHPEDSLLLNLWICWIINTTLFFPSSLWLLGEVDAFVFMPCLVVVLKYDFPCFLLYKGRAYNL